MLAYGDADLVLAMKAETNINATIAINAINADADLVLAMKAETNINATIAINAINADADLVLAMKAETNINATIAINAINADADLVLAMKAETNINATIAINADADTDVIAINTGSITSPPDAAPRHDSGQSSSGTPVQPARQRRARTCFLRPCPKKYSPDGGKIPLPGTAPCLSLHTTVL